MEINKGDIVLCEFYFSDLNKSKKRPVLVLKDNLPFEDFVGIPLSSQIQHLYQDEYFIDNDSFISGSIPKRSKLMLRKTFVVSKHIVLKKYGTISNDKFVAYHTLFCKFFECGQPLL